MTNTIEQRVWSMVSERECSMLSFLSGLQKPPHIPLVGQFIAIEFTLNIFGVVVAYWLE
jgi:hypothetical protein